MNFRTQIDIQPSELKIKHQNKLLMLGSCFVESIGNILLNNKFSVNLNPFGVLYNPQSIAHALRRLINKEEFSSRDVFEHNGLYHSLMHHGKFSNSDKQECIDMINTSFIKACDDLLSVNILFITFGTAYVYEHKATQTIVGNCHKLPNNNFERYRLSITDIVTNWEALIDELVKINPKLKIIFTVSPIRHMRDGAHDNQLSKSTLLIAIEQLCKQYACTNYFPSYELVLDDLRDYRFYKEDMIHPNDLAIKYIWRRFTETYLTQATININKEWSKLNSSISHRAINEKSETHKHFLQQTLLRLHQFESKYPYICLSNDIGKLEARISKLEKGRT